MEEYFQLTRCILAASNDEHLRRRARRRVGCRIEPVHRCRHWRRQLGEGVIAAAVVMQPSRDALALLHQDIHLQRVGGAARWINAIRRFVGFDAACGNHSTDSARSIQELAELTVRDRDIVVMPARAPVFEHGREGLIGDSKLFEIWTKERNDRIRHSRLDRRQRIGPAAKPVGSAVRTAMPPATAAAVKQQVVEFPGVDSLIEFLLSRAGRSTRRRNRSVHSRSTQTASTSSGMPKALESSSARLEGAANAASIAAPRQSDNSTRANERGDSSTTVVPSRRRNANLEEMNLAVGFSRCAPGRYCPSTGTAVRSGVSPTRTP